MSAAMVVPGIYPDLTMAEYLAIPAVSAGVARAVVDECPLSGWFQSPFNPSRVLDQSKASDVGSITHQIFLEGGRMDGIEVIDPRDHPAEKTGAIPEGFTNKSIRAARDAARAAGKIPVLLDTMDEIETASDAIYGFAQSLKQEEPAVWAALQPDGGQSEVTMVWIDNGVPCKLRTDRISTDYGVTVDLKTTTGSVDPDRWGRTQLIGEGYYFSAAWYRRGIEKLTGVQTEYLFLAAMQNAPHLCSLIGVDAATLDLGARKVERALAVWARCQANQNFPAYPSRAVYPSLPAWESMKFDNVEQQDPFLLGTQA